MENCSAPRSMLAAFWIIGRGELRARGAAIVRRVGETGVRSAGKDERN